MIRSLDRKLVVIRATAHTTHEFILADAKDVDLVFGTRAPGPRSYLARPGARAKRDDVMAEMPAPDWPKRPDERMNSLERLSYDRARLG
jgi:hypothetical protein